MPEQFYNLIHDLISKIPNSDKVIWSVHCHNDLGFAVANSLAAVKAELDKLNAHQRIG